MTAKRILIVDDDRETCRLIAELVGGPGRTLEDATSPREALDRIRDQRFDLVISDINLNASE
jgi:CheY-like chemotaxis protein